MSKDGYSRKGLFGTIHHYDSNGKKVGESRPGFFGSMNHYDSSGRKTGHSIEEELKEVIHIYCASAKDDLDSLFNLVHKGMEDEYIDTTTILANFVFLTLGDKWSSNHIYQPQHS